MWLNKLRTQMTYQKRTYTKVLDMNILSDFLIFIFISRDAWFNSRFLWLLWACGTQSWKELSQYEKNI